MITKAQAIRIFATAYSKFTDISDDRDLKRNNLTLSDYHTVYDILKLLSGCRKGEQAKTFCPAPARWFEKNGFTVKEPNGNEVNYIISLYDL